MSLAPDECLLVTAFPEGLVLEGRNNMFLQVGGNSTELYYSPVSGTMKVFVLACDPWVSGVCTLSAKRDMQHFLLKKIPILAPWTTNIKHDMIPEEHKFNCDVYTFLQKEVQQEYLQV